MNRQPVILVVDDTPANIKLLDAILAPRGYTVVPAGSGAEALTQVAASPPDLILLDIVMPGMDGYEVCRRLRDNPATSVLPVVMITASGEQEKIKAIEAGADDFVPKPFNQAELLARIRSLLRIKSYHDTIQGQAAELAEWNRTLSERVDERTRELQEARALILQLYQALAERNRDLQQMVAQMMAAQGQGGPQAADGQSAAMEKLTAREQEVLRLVAQGQTNNEIATALVVSLATVKTHVEHIIAKLGVSDRTQAAVRAVELGFLPART
jgi:DNA-binding NarL/FixJ family response regulator